MRRRFLWGITVGNLGTLHAVKYDTWSDCDTPCYRMPTGLLGDLSINQSLHAIHSKPPNTLVPTGTSFHASAVLNH